MASGNSETFWEWLTSSSQEVGPDGKLRKKVVVTTGAVAGKQALSTKPTHYKMNGGSVFVDDSFMSAFNERYAEAVNCGETLSFVETRTPVYRMLFDFDFTDNQEIEMSYMAEVLTVIRGVIKLFYKDHDPETMLMYVFSAPTKAVRVEMPTKQVIDMVKTGFHVIMPNLHVDSKTALTLLDAAVSELSRVLGRRQLPLNTWGDVVDRCVHVGNGLRLPYSVKHSRCARCVKQRTAKAGPVVCDLCKGGFVSDGRVYKPHSVFSAEGINDEAEALLMKTDTKYCMEKATIRLITVLFGSKYVDPSLTPGFELPRGFQLSAVPRVRTKNGDVSKKVRVSLSGENLVGNHPLVTDIENFITSNSMMLQLGTPSNPYSKCVVNKVMLPSSTAKNKKVIINVYGEGSTYCCNVGREHTSSSVYFIVTDNSLYQMCFSKKEGVPGRTPCSQFKSRPVLLPPELVSRLFDAEDRGRQVVDAINNSLGASRGSGGSGSSSPEYHQGFSHMEAEKRRLYINLIDGDAPFGPEDEQFQRKTQEWDSLRARHDTGKLQRFIENTKHIINVTRQNTMAITKDTSFPIPVTDPVSGAPMSSEDIDRMSFADLLKLSGESELPNTATDSLKGKRGNGGEGKRGRSKKRARCQH